MAHVPQQQVVVAELLPVIVDARLAHQPRQVGEADPTVDHRRPAPIHPEHALWQPWLEVGLGFEIGLGLGLGLGLALTLSLTCGSHCA